MFHTERLIQDAGIKSVIGLLTTVHLFQLELKENKTIILSVWSFVERSRHYRSSFEMITFRCTLDLPYLFQF